MEGCQPTRKDIFALHPFHYYTPLLSVVPICSSPFFRSNGDRALAAAVGNEARWAQGHYCLYTHVSTSWARVLLSLHSPPCKKTLLSMYIWHAMWIEAPLWPEKKSLRICLAFFKVEGQKWARREIEGQVGYSPKLLLPPFKNVWRFRKRTIKFI